MIMRSVLAGARLEELIRQPDGKDQPEKTSDADGSDPAEEDGIQEQGGPK